MTKQDTKRSPGGYAPRRWLSPTLFALIALCFFLPFATVSCDGARTSFTGVQLVTETVPSGGKVEEPPDCNADLSTCVEHQASVTAAAALFSALVGLLLGLFGISRGPGWFATLTFGALVTLALRVFEPLGPEVTLRAGLDVALLFSTGTVALHARWAWKRRRAQLADDADGVSAALAPTGTLADDRDEPQGGAR